MLRARAGTESLPADFAKVMTRLEASQQQRHITAWIQMAFEMPLRKSFRSVTFFAYQAQVLDASVPEDARSVLLRIMAQQESGLSLALRDSLVRMQCSLPEGPSVPVGLKAQALTQLGSNRRLANPGILLRYARSDDVRLKHAAYQALGHRIRLNRGSGDSTGNRQIFDSLKMAAGGKPDLHQVRAMAQMSADYARNYLADHCNSVEKMVTVLRHESNPSHPILLKAAANFLDSGTQEAQVAPVLLEEVQDPAPSLERLLSGNPTEADAGSALKRVFPQAASTSSIP